MRPHSLVVVGVAAGQLEQIRIEEGVGCDQTFVAQVVGVALDHGLTCRELRLLHRENIHGKFP